MFRVPEVLGSLVKVYERKGGQLSVSAEMINSLCISPPRKSVWARQDQNTLCNYMLVYKI